MRVTFHPIASDCSMVFLPRPKRQRRTSAFNASPTISVNLSDFQVFGARRRAA